MMKIKISLWKKKTCVRKIMKMLCENFEFFFMIFKFCFYFFFLPADWLWRRRRKKKIMKMMILKS